MRTKTRCPRCGNRLIYSMRASVKIEVDATNLNIYNKKHSFEETVGCLVCNAILPTKVIEMAKLECRPVAKANGLYFCLNEKL
jgi:Pyruvate/2-oxoacid:ferredoxin oxidoreductase delta subunit